MIEEFKQANITLRYYHDSCLCCINTSADKVQFPLIALCWLWVLERLNLIYIRLLRATSDHHMWQSHSFYGFLTHIHTHTFSSADSQGLAYPMVLVFSPVKRLSEADTSSGGRSTESVCANSLMRQGMFCRTLWEITSKLHRQELASLGAKPESSQRTHLASSFSNKPLWETMTMMTLMMKIMMIRSLGSCAFCREC